MRAAMPKGNAADHHVEPPAAPQPHPEERPSSPPLPPPVSPVSKPDVSARPQASALGHGNLQL
jgi:hypothetical protein